MSTNANPKSSNGFSMPLLLVAFLTVALACFVLWYMGDRDQNGTTKTQQIETSNSEGSTDGLTINTPEISEDFSDADMEKLDAQFESVTQDYNDSFSDIQ